MAAVEPGACVRRSFVYRRLAEAGAAFVEQNGGAVATGFGAGVDMDVEAAGKLGLADLSPLPRTGFKGRGTPVWLDGQGIVGLDEDNMAYGQADGSLVARLAPTEMLVLGDLHGRADLCARLDRAWSWDTASACYPVLRSDASFWFVVTGDHAAAMFAKICGVDLRAGSFALGRIAQTSVARMSAIIIRCDFGSAPAYAILGDSASAEYLWNCLVDAMAEFDGRLVGLAALQRLHGK